MTRRGRQARSLRRLRQWVGQGCSDVQPSAESMEAFWQPFRPRRHTTQGTTGPQQLEGMQTAAGRSIACHAAHNCTEGCVLEASSLAGSPSGAEDMHAKEGTRGPQRFADMQTAASRNIVCHAAHSCSGSHRHGRSPAPGEARRQQ